MCPREQVEPGALGNRAIIEAVSGIAEEFTFPLIVDPVMISKHGAPLLEPDACDLLRKRLLPLAYLVTPNLPEAAALSGLTSQRRAGNAWAAQALAAMGARNVLIKGGRLVL